MGSIPSREKHYRARIWGFRGGSVWRRQERCPSSGTAQKKTGRLRTQGGPGGSAGQDGSLSPEETTRQVASGSLHLTLAPQGWGAERPWEGGQEDGVRVVWTKRKGELRGEVLHGLTAEGMAAGTWGQTPLGEGGGWAISKGFTPHVRQRHDSPGTKLRSGTGAGARNRSPPPDPSGTTDSQWPVMAETPLFREPWN